MSRDTYTWENTKKDLVTLNDGKYWLPANSDNVYGMIEKIEINGCLDKGLQHIFGTENQALNIDIHFDRHYYALCRFTTIAESDADVWIALYQTGKSEPIWADCKKPKELKDTLKLTCKIELEAGEYFLFLNNIRFNHCESDSYINSFDYACRYNFMVHHDGKELKHPTIQEIKLKPRPLSDWKSYVQKNWVNTNWLETTTINAKIRFKEPVNLTDNYFRIEVFDESLNWIGWSDYCSTKGELHISGVYPILDGEFQFVVLHNNCPFLCGKFVYNCGNCNVTEMSEWSDNSVLGEALRSRKRSYKIKNKPTSYGRRLEFMEYLINYTDMIIKYTQDDDLLEQRLSEAEKN